MKLNTCFWTCLLVGLTASCKGPQPEITSPDGTIRLSFLLTEEGIPSYSVDVKGQSFVESSTLGLAFREEGVNLSSGLTLKGVKKSSKDETWTQPWGENKTNRDHHNELAVALQGAGGEELTLRFRVFDDGFAWRYEVAVPGTDSLHLTAEKSTFRFHEDGDSWSIPANFDTYELRYRKMPLSEVPDANTPITFKTQGGVYASVHEAAIYNYPEMVLVQEDPLHFVSSLAPLDRSGLLARLPSAFNTPWRTVQVSDEAVGLINSSLILNLNEPCALEDVSWVKPAKYIGVWWSLHLGLESWGVGPHHGATTEAALRYIDFAAANNIQGVLFEGWNDAWKGDAALPGFDFTSPAPDFDMVKVTDYARAKGIDFIVHNETGGNVERFEQQLERALDWDESLGIHYLKTGYAGGGLHGGKHRHSQYGVVHFQHVIEEAAARQINVDAHETIKASGIRRTWPNFMTRECARGMEWNGWSEGNEPFHHEILPFTRLLGGPMDYTPGIFDIDYSAVAGRNPNERSWGQPASECRTNTTLCKQIANWVILYSPLQMACDLLENYDGHPAFQFFRDFNADCDASRALQGEPGEFIAVVRRAGENFYYGATTDETGRTLVQPLSFLEPGVTYTARIYADGPDADWRTKPESYTITEKTVTCTDTLEVILAPGGGQAITFLPCE